MTRPYEISDIVAMLTERVESLCHELFPNGIREGSEFRIGSLAGEIGRSMGICIRGAKAGVWADFHSGESGDALDLVARTLFAGDKGKALSWSRRWLGIDDRDPKDLAQSRRRAAERDQRAEREEKQTRQNAFKRWLEAKPEIKATPVDLYLKGRGLDLAQLGYQPRSLRYHPNLHCNERGEALPAMLGAIVNAKGQVISVHRTWLELDEGEIIKARLKNNKKTYGRYAGGCIRLWRGGHWTETNGVRFWQRAPKLEDAGPGARVVITEGIEDGLSVALADPEARVLVAVALPNIANVELPAGISTVTICADNEANEEAQRASDRALAQAVARFRGEGRRVLIARSPIGKDFNDAIREGMKA